MTNLSTTVQLVNEEQAEIWLKRKYKHQRAVNWGHVKDLARAMFDGTFSPVSTIMFSSINGDYHLINGQHTLHAIVMSKKAQTLPVTYYSVQDEAEEAELYYRIDRQRKRSLADSIRSTELPERLGLTPTKMREIASALRFIKNGFGSQAKKNNFVSDDDLVEWLPMWAWECRQLYHAITPSSDRERNLIVRQAVFGVALITMRYQPEKAREFWYQVARDDGLERHDPRKTLRTWLFSAQGQSLAPGKRLRSNELARGDHPSLEYLDGWQGAEVYPSGRSTIDCQDYGDGL